MSELDEMKHKLTVCMQYAHVTKLCFEKSLINSYVHDMRDRSFTILSLLSQIRLLGELTSFDDYLTDEYVEQVNKFDDTLLLNEYERLMNEYKHLKG